jgi:hypothetical protein
MPAASDRSERVGPQAIINGVVQVVVSTEPQLHRFKMQGDRRNSKQSSRSRQASESTAVHAFRCVQLLSL